MKWGSANAPRRLWNLSLQCREAAPLVFAGSYDPKIVRETDSPLWALPLTSQTNGLNGRWVQIAFAA